jgi:hypothetical protein
MIDLTLRNQTKLNDTIQTINLTNNQFVKIFALFSIKVVVLLQIEIIFLLAQMGFLFSDFSIFGITPSIRIHFYLVLLRSSMIL